MQRQEVEIGGIKVGDAHPVRVVAELSTYYNQDIGIAKEYIDFAKKVGCDFIKSEILHDLSIIHDAAMSHTYMTGKGSVTENYRSLLERKMIDLKDYEKIYKYALDKGVPVLASVYDLKGVDFLVSIGASAVKLSSQHITHRPLIEHCAKSGLVLMMDTGNAYTTEIVNAVQWAEDCHVKGMILHHRPDGNPCPPEKHNMRILTTLKERFRWPTGLSCHYEGDEMIYLAIGLGANVIEKPFYHKKEKDDQDTMFTLSYEEYEKMVKKVHECSLALGKYERDDLIPGQLECRMCLVAKEDIPKGTELDLDNVTFAWPMSGIPSSEWPEVKGLSAARVIKKGFPIKKEDLNCIS